jgi:small subunit ribosomal protein S3
VGQKVHPTGFRLGVIRTWTSRWFEEKRYADLLHEDLRIKKFVKDKLEQAGISRVEIERKANRVKVNIHTARPGIVIGKRGAGVEQLKKELQKLTGGADVAVNIHEVRKAEVDAQLVAENIAVQLERRVAFRRAMKKALQTAMKFGARGIKVACSGRLGGHEMSRYEWYRDGRVPLQTLRADIDYGFAQAFCTYGVIGVKCWIFKGEVLAEKVRPTPRMSGPGMPPPPRSAPPAGPATPPPTTQG